MNIQVLNSPYSRSLLIHGMFLLVAFWFAAYAPKIDLSQSDPIEFEVLAPKATKDDSKPTKTIVRSSEGELAKQAKEDSYLSEKTKVVKEQISARNSGDTSSVQSSPSASTGQAKSAAKAPRSQHRPIDLSELGVKINPYQNTKFEQQRNWANQSTGESMRGGEYIQGMKQGEVSALNTKEFVFYSYFERVRRQLDSSWQPLLRGQVAKLYKNGRKLASNSDYVTRTLVTLNSKGEVARVQLVEESGTVDIDDAALDALNKAGPYPNPPKGLMDASGQVQIRWDFVLKT